jgi:hypothetical protein
VTSGTLAQATVLVLDRGPFGLFRPAVAAATISDVEEELVSRKELTATLFAINDLRDDVREIRRLLEEDDGEAEEDDA